MLTSTAPSPSHSPTPGSGAVTTPTGDLHIPSSTRADGSLRKEIKIRPGYRPPEDVEVYKNRTAEAWKTRGNGGVPGAEGLKVLGEVTDSGTTGGKNAKRREARKRAKERDGEEGEERVVNGEEQKTISTMKLELEAKDNLRANAPTAAKETESELDPEIEKEKQARNLKKKLRQARELREKKDKGEGLLPEQLEKVIKIQELVRQLDSLGFDDDGAKKPKDVK